ncbi:MAG: hypothetical protein U0903_18870 [Planctomycetales bacterium]
MPLFHYHSIRSALKGAEAVPGTRKVAGEILVVPNNLEGLKILQDRGHVDESTSSDGVVDFGLVTSIPPEGILVKLVLSPQHLHYYEDINDLLRHSTEEPDHYYLFGHGSLSSSSEQVPDSVAKYRQMLRMKRLLQQVADFPEAGKVTLLTPEKLEIPFHCTSADLQSLIELPELERQLGSASIEREQRIILFKRCLREHLRAHFPETRFVMLLRNLSSVYDAYNRDYELWVGNSFGELEKTFEEKRLKFIVDLNGILGGIQSSILAVPIATLLMADKFDLAKPGRNTFLSASVLIVGAIALKLLDNQQNTLEATSHAIEAVRNDFEKKQNTRKDELRSRLGAVLRQEDKVRRLLSLFRFGILGILAAVVVIWFGSLIYFSRNDTASPKEAPLATGQILLPSPSDAPR